jgi:hypothetical protein
MAAAWGMKESAGACPVEAMAPIITISVPITRRNCSRAKRPMVDDGMM